MAQLLVVILHDLARLPALLTAWKEVGVPGVTLLHSLGGYQAESWLRRMGLGGLGRLLERGEVQQRTLLSLIADEALLERAIAVADEVVQGFDRPDSGVLFVVPVSRALGLRKWGEPTGEGVEAPPPTRIPLTIDRTTPVSTIVDVLRLEPAIVRADAPLEAVVNKMLAHYPVHLACVVNEEERLVGVIDVVTLADVALLAMFPEEFLSELTVLEQVEDFARRTQIRRAADIMLDPAWVRMDDTVQDAFHVIHQRKLPGVPVVDDRYHVIGYINLLELLGACLRIKREGGSTA